MAKGLKIFLATAGVLVFPAAIGIGVGIGFATRESAEKSTQSMNKSTQAIYEKQGSSIANADVKSKYTQAVAAYSKKMQEDSTKIINEVLETFKWMDRFDQSNIVEQYNKGVQALNKIITDIMKEIEKDYNGGKKANGLESIKDKLNKDKLTEIVRDEKVGLAKLVEEVGKEVGKYAKKIFEHALKENSQTKDIPALNEVIDAVDKYFTDAKENAFTKLAKELKEFDFSALEKEGYNKTLEKLMGLVSKARTEAVKILDSIKNLKADEKAKIKEAIRPYYTALNKALSSSVGLLTEKLKELAPVIENLK
ncbi:Uncharacterised protein [Metamycoplasma arthritidis]|uniref:Hypothetical membrane protein n=1 Tax=Metamycoplasma arthritidis (strain 158L3-1) TaxID=243272 RepID=B3PMF5_META1|nr:hypothetical protein [Metamycoplasma arthritidis]ACF07207.1 hypothetical membrane protein [Metamycoplasma arthritidis 158L3-1]VEU78731.1 Uncharacterised protein [Metamycoplasma arthritidis]